MPRFHLLTYRMRPVLPVLFLFVLTLVFILTACGDSVASGAGSGSSGGSAQNPPIAGKTPTVVANPVSAQGCPSSAVVTSLVKATITVTDSSKDAVVNAHTGDVIEFRFPFGKKWSGPQSSQGGLDLQGPAGYASKANSACTWDFAARSTGKTELTFNSQPLCKRGELCPQYIISFPFTINVK